MGGNMTMELLQQTITGPLREQIGKIERAVLILRDTGLPDVRVLGNAAAPAVWHWTGSVSDPRLLPEHFRLLETITPLSIWQQWHHGTAISDGKTTLPLKDIQPKHCPKKSQRTYSRMRKFCKALDTASTTETSASLSDLATRYQANFDKFRDSGILLPQTTPIGRKRTRDENGWGYISREYERRLKLQKKAEDRGLTFAEVEREDNEKERERQRTKRAKTKHDGIGNVGGLTSTTAVSVNVRDEEAAGEVSAPEMLRDFDSSLLPAAMVLFT